MIAPPTNPEALREAPPPIPVRGFYYLTECENCGWVGSSEQCSTDSEAADSDVYCPVCGSGGCEDEPSAGDTARHGEAVYQRIVAMEAARDAATAQAERTAGELAAAEARIAVLEAELSKRPPRHSPDFPCPKCGVRRGMFPACAQDGCPLLDSNGKPFVRADLTDGGSDA